MFKILTTVGVALFAFAWAFKNTLWIMNWFASKGLGEVTQPRQKAPVEANTPTSQTTTTAVTEAPVAVSNTSN